MDTGTEELQHHERSSRGGCLIVGVIVLFVFYVLSPPLVVLLLEMLPGRTAESLNEALIVLYTPLRWAYLNNEGVKSFYDWYMGLFGVS